MKEKIEQLAKGKFEYQMPELLLSEDKLILRAQAGKCLRGSFVVSNSKHRRMKGVVYSDSRLMQLERPQFIGEDNEIPYVFHAEHAQAGEKFQGKLQLITDAGETSLPYEVQTGFPCFHTSIGEVRDLFQFTSLAKADWEEAEKLFFSEEFEQTCFYRDDRFATLYRTLAATGKKGQALEEFLVATGKKAPVTIELETKKFSYQAGNYNFCDRLVFKKSGWGYARFEISADADFIRLDRTQFLAEDFVNNRLELEFVIQTRDMKEGIHSAQICVSSSKKQLQVPVVCFCEKKHSEESRKRQSQQKLTLRLVHNYLQFRCGQRSARQYVTEAEGAMAIFREESVPREEQLLVRFYQIHIWQLSGKDAAVRNAMQIFQESGTAELEQYPSVIAAYYYTAATVKKPQLTAEEAAGKIAELYQQYPDNWLLLCLLLQLDERYHDPKRRYEALKQYQSGKCRNPVMLYEAVACLAEEPVLLKALDGFELRCLKFAVKYEYMNDAVQRQLIFLAARSRQMPSLLYHILTKLYQKNPAKELLGVLCTLIIRNGDKSGRYFPWMKLGVAEQLRITELMEFYLYCMDEEHEEAMHPSVYTYFSYNSELSAKKRALLYASLIRTKKENAAIYRTYRPQLEQFAAEQLRAGNISRHLSVLYQDVYADSFPGGEYGDTLAALNFAMELRVKNKSFTQFTGEMKDGMDCGQLQSVCVVHPEGFSSVVPFHPESTVITVCSEKAEIFLIDVDGCYYPLHNLDQRYGGEYQVTLERLLPMERYLWDCFEAGCNDLRLLLHLEEEINTYQKYEEQSIEIYKRLVKAEGISQKHRNACIRALLDHYYENFEGEAFEYYLRQVSLDCLDARERAKMINHFLMRGFHQEAMEALQRYGTEGVDVRRIARLLHSQLYELERMEPDEFLLELAQYVFDCGKQESLILEYLMRYYRGATERMYAIWKAAKSEEMDTTELEESLLGQILFAEVYIAQADTVFLSYYQHGMNHKLIRAYLSYNAYKYLVRDRIVSEKLFEVMEHEVRMEDNEVCTLALLKAYASEETLTEKQLKFADYKLHELLKRHMFLPFFRGFSATIPLPEKLLERYYVDYRTNPEYKVKIHYLIGNGNDFITEEMQDQCYGIFVKDFLLFEGETLQYYITEEQDGTEKLTESITLTMNSELKEGRNSRLERLNLILSAHQMQEDATVLDLLEQYILQEHEALQLFRGI